ncbi:MAG TPA: hypothetical protein VFP35_01865 [Candidatus Saccharimonadales bacterium]|nr:hypothetical protein [Candidatus Saccharimonadales bacterium]
MDSLQDILSQKDFSPPDEIKSLRDYVKRKYKSNSYIKLEREAVILSVPSSALAATLQLERTAIAEACGLTKKLVIRFGRQ